MMIALRRVAIRFGFFIVASSVVGTAPAVADIGSVRSSTTIHAIQTIPPVIAPPVATPSAGADRISFDGGTSWTAVSSFAFAATRPNTANDGEQRSNRVHTPLTVTIAVDSSTPKLFKAAAAGTVVPSIVIAFRGGTYTLTNALIASMQSDPSASAIPRERLTITYEKIVVSGPAATQPKP